MAMIVLLWIAGGASREDTLSQVVVRAGCWSILVVAILAGPRPALRANRSVLLLLLAAIVLPLLQLIPLPPAWWQTLPGRDILVIPGEPVPWRPLTMTPGATRNALASLIVPSTMFVLLAQANERTFRWMPTILLGMIGFAVLLGLLQFSGAGFNNPLLNDTPGVVSGIFANRNHFALFIALGCLITPVWAFTNRNGIKWRGPIAAGLMLLFVLTILATGSRTGILLGGLSVTFAATLVGKRLRRRLAGAPKWVVPAVVLTVIFVVAGIVVLSFAADRATSINRVLSTEGGEDMRTRALPTVLHMVGSYMPTGSGFGGFDPIFRIHEPFGLLKLTYFNQAHNDYLGIALDGGIPGLALLLAGIVWWLNASVRVWRMRADELGISGQLGSLVILLVLIASITDYPARTPTVMAIIVIAAMWMVRARGAKSEPALPA
ncbi:O-antigen ligase family protein [Sphingomonas phyllosphaerae]|uniref:O-antigen ligase family protein n=1 Tax=Sphingomonas phyllosphaerae TaxID=257003 RepID=UPI002FF8810F